MSRLTTLAAALALIAGLAASATEPAVPATEQPSAAQATSASATVERLHAALLEAMHHAGSEHFDERVALLEPVVSQSFDFETIARIVLGREWSRLDDAQRARFLDTFRRLSVATYASRFDAFDGERFELVEEAEASRPGYRIVRTRLVEADGDSVSLDYMLRQTPQGWRIVNVIADGVSDLSLKRADYRAVIASDGFDGLLARLEQQIAGYRAGDAA